MRGLSNDERELLAYVVRYPGHTHGPRGQRRASAGKVLLMLRLEVRGLVFSQDCPDPCPYAHWHPTPMVSLALECDSIVRRLTA